MVTQPKNLIILIIVKKINKVKITMLVIMWTLKWNYLMKHNRS